MSAITTTERKVEDLQVGDVMVLREENPDKTVSTYFTMVNANLPIGDDIEYRIYFLAEVEGVGVIEETFTAMDNQRVSVLV